ncbi:MAG: STAS/SEC14 domain-containing protein [Paracoccaceae bacterium]
MSIDVTEHHDTALLELHITGRITEEQMQQMGPAIERFAAQHARIDVLERIGPVDGVRLGAAAPGMRTDSKVLSRIRKLAVLGDQSWIANFARMGNRELPAEIRIFAPEEEAQARQWLAA